MGSGDSGVVDVRRSICVDDAGVLRPDYSVLHVLDARIILGLEIRNIVVPLSLSGLVHPFSGVDEGRLKNRQLLSSILEAGAWGNGPSLDKVPQAAGDGRDGIRSSIALHGPQNVRLDPDVIDGQVISNIGHLDQHVNARSRVPDGNADILLPHSGHIAEAQASGPVGADLHIERGIHVEAEA